MPSESETVEEISAIHPLPSALVVPVIAAVSTYAILVHAHLNANTFTRSLGALIIVTTVALYLSAENSISQQRRAWRERSSEDVQWLLAAAGLELTRATTRYYTQAEFSAVIRQWRSLVDSHTVSDEVVRRAVRAIVSANPGDLVVVETIGAAITPRPNDPDMVSVSSAYALEAVLTTMLESGVFTPAVFQRELNAEISHIRLLSA